MKKHLFLSSTGLKLIAIATMVVDHVGMLFFPEEPLFRVVGRVSFPMFAFLIAEGFEKTSNARNYLFRLLAFAALSQIPYSLFMQATDLSPARLNIFFTLAAGLLALMALKKLIPVYSILCVALLALLAEVGIFDYGMYGVLTVLASSLFLHLRKAGVAVLLALPLFCTGVLSFLGSFSLQVYAALSVPLLMLYNGERGRQFPRLFFYAFYPVHILILTSIWYLIH